MVDIRNIHPFKTALEREKITFLEPTHAWVVMKERTPPSQFPVPIVSLIIESASGVVVVCDM